MTDTSFYDDEYYQSHYGRVLNDERYYKLLGHYWRRAIFQAHGLDPAQAVLDYGCGIGQVSAALPNATMHDIAPFVMDRLEAMGRPVIRDPAAIPQHHFDAVLSSHSLEHVAEPAKLLERFRHFVRPRGSLILVLPIEVNTRPSLKVDNDRHLYCWTFQTITNLLLECGWLPTSQCVLHAPFLLHTFGARFHSSFAVDMAHRLGSLRRAFPSALTVATAQP